MSLEGNPKQSKGEQRGLLARHEFSTDIYSDYDD